MSELSTPPPLERAQDQSPADEILTRESTEYAQVLKMLGNGRVEAMCFDGEKRLAHIRGKMRKKVRVSHPRLARGVSELN